ncbi:hypothetical protein GTP44_25310 [Duganella sp. FT50W]|uniref:Uncharacterized protein n=1 Tax=Duganella lactea TaxID=2692173 RepID=A0A6L8MTA9_9BURK|nr:hypothetical protein [Duganella lactea]MYM85244.1 hypothetical protein [Duganella lactea]
MNIKIRSEEKNLRNSDEDTGLDNVPRPYFGYRDVKEALAEMRSAHEKMTDEDYQRSDEEMRINLLSTTVS